jgi:uncharacterized protein YjbI with pentapeptide repeats
MQSTIEIGNKIAVARKLKNLSQAELAERMSVTSQAAGKWERGESMPDILTFVRLAAVLGVDLNYFGEDGSEGLPEPPRTYETPEAEQPAPEDGAARKLGWNMSGGNWANADFSGLSGLGDRFSGANIQKCKFVGSGMAGLTLRGNNVQDSDFSDSDLRQSRLIGCNLQNINFTGCDFSGSEHRSCNIHLCTLDRADFTDALFKGCHLGNINTRDVKWLRTHFIGSSLFDLALEGEITDCAFEGLGVKRVVFRNVTLRNSFFKNCNLKKLQFENCRADRLTLAFLASSKADVSGILPPEGEE